MRPHYDYSRPTEQAESPFTPGVKALLIITVGAYVLQVFVGRVLLEYFALSLTGLRRGFVWQFLTYGFLHGGMFHIFFNLLGLFIFGRDIEARFGTKRFVRLYLGAIVFGGVIFAAWAHFVQPMGRVVGASGGVVALLVIYAFCWPHRRFLLFLVMPVPAWLMAGLFVLIDIGNALNNDLGAVVHVAGAVFGFTWLIIFPKVGWLGGVLRKGRATSSASDRRRMDRILDKVHDKGLHSLSWREKRFLKRMGKQMDEQQNLGEYRRTRRQEWSEWSDDSS